MLWIVNAGKASAAVDWPLKSLQAGQEPLAGTSTSYHVHKHLDFVLAEEAILKGKGMIIVPFSNCQLGHDRSWISPWNPKHIAKLPAVLHWTYKEGREAKLSDEASPLNALNQVLQDSHKHGSILSTTVHTWSPPGATTESIAHPQACGGGSFEWSWGHLGDNRAHSHNFNLHPGFEAEGTAVCWTQVSGLEMYCSVCRSG